MTETLSTLANRLGKQLIKQGMQLVTAESCTGGGLSYWLTSVSGSSAWFERGYVTYSNHAKIEMLGISPAKLKRYGAVSREIAEAMAIGALKHKIGRAHV